MFKKIALALLAIVGLSMIAAKIEAAYQNQIDHHRNQAHTKGWSQGWETGWNSGFGEANRRAYSYVDKDAYARVYGPFTIN